MINALLLQALRERASDVHFEPYEARSVVRFRIDGVLRDVLEPPRALHAALVSRIKIMASLDIAEKRLPQDGRLGLKLGDKLVDVRVSTLPTGPGERVVLRLLDKDSAQLDLTALGMSPATLATVDRLIREPHGIVLVTGPTGSGKTTTLYAALSRLPRGTLNMMTVEDPVEYALDGVGQTQVNPKIDLDFARALRAILRQDPDIIMIGEIRDLETAQIAVQASLTGHLVLATLPHQRRRERDDPASPTWGSSRICWPRAFSASRAALVSRLCPRLPHAGRATVGEAQLLADLGLPPTLALYVPSGCAECNDTGLPGPLWRVRAHRRSTMRSAGRSTIRALLSMHCARSRAAAGTTSLRRTARAGSRRHDFARRARARSPRRTEHERPPRSLRSLPPEGAHVPSGAAAPMNAFRYEAVDARASSSAGGSTPNRCGRCATASGRRSLSHGDR
jgi:general secretion pathway protein E